MFFVRNWSLVRQVYIWGLDLASKVIYGRRAASWRRRQFELMTSGSVEGSASDETVTVTVDGVENGRLVQSGASAAERLGAVGQTRALAQRLERLNSELELGSLGEWESYDAIGGFWDVVGDETAQSDLTREETSLVSQRAGRTTSGASSARGDTAFE
ncbi:1-acylglycerol-3-phosphate O-acyltransferase 6 (lysophosphatidic acid acyltransferase, zeta) [Cyanidiococcus yangmingshanensis]|uniref:1-acylglycerol-3-phosphate O-acyltransferase 6 (Lysophosphatidic acid acyltransferase, zeta) n=1 Tax=Cyanidiococcus yangmingshanensis TaxID=2690220 RepID=A0A7J7II71_9RHOD|nr:1-acylglycerol-3-phosphate O-acyltransferase 6 (lysophosphatidic acid acyltransferase, zeta) [Cyanidiococcus yangmingshanensis]